MSRSHLYRASGPARPLLAVVLSALWCGAALILALVTAPHVGSGVELTARAAAVQERLAIVLAAGAILVGLIVIMREILNGRSWLRRSRLAGAVVLAGAGGFGLLDTARYVLRPGTPAYANGSGISATPALPVVAADDMARQRLFWTTVGLLGGGLVLACGTAALRTTEPTL